MTQANLISNAATYLDGSHESQAGRVPAFFVREIPVYGDAILSPMDGYSDLPFRLLCRELGSAMSYTEFVLVEDIIAGRKLVSEKLSFTEPERPLVYQIYGDDPRKFLEAALLIREQEPDIIDINMGCPAKSISARGAGVGLMRTPEKIAEIFSLLTKHLDIPITGKIRLGWDEDSRNYLEVARIVEDNGGSLLAVHGRTRAQGYGGEADWDAIAEIVDALSIPVVGNGDVAAAADIDRIKEHTGCAAAMIARAAMYNPWIFAGLDRKHVTPAQVEDTMRRHLSLNLEFYGPARGLVLFRKFAARYLTPYKLPRPLRQRLLTLEKAGEFIDLLAEIVADEMQSVLPPS